MATIDSSDIIFATVIQRGMTIASLRLIGINSMADVVRSVRTNIGAATGLTTINLRNGSRGWRTSSTVMF